METAYDIINELEEIDLELDLEFSCDIECEEDSYDGFFNDEEF